MTITCFGIVLQTAVIAFPDFLGDGYVKMLAERFLGGL